jgi:ribosomal protein L14E/L6E/L27E
MDYEIKKIDIGSIVISLKGRDSGNVYMVCKVIDADYLLLVDGKAKRLDCPKKKRIKHVKQTAMALPLIAEKLRKEKQVFDAEIISALRNISEGGKQNV